jgi:hypothetical protein
LGAIIVTSTSLGGTIWLKWMLNPWAKCLLPGLGARVQAHHYVQPAVSQVQSVGVALGAEADDADGLALDQADVRVVLVVNLGHGAVFSL